HARALLPAGEIFVDGRARVEAEGVDRKKAGGATGIAEEELLEVARAPPHRRLGLARVSDDDVGAEGHAERARPVRDAAHGVEVAVETTRLADAGQLLRIPRFEPKTGGHVGARHELELLAIDEVDANQEPRLSCPTRTPRQPLEEGLAPAPFHPEQRVGDEQRPAAEIEKAVEPVDLLHRL